MHIEKYARRRGVKVSWVRIWPSKRDPDNVVVRLNGEDNQNALRLENRSFWPHGVVCRPWVNHNEYPKRKRKRKRTNTYSQNVSRGSKHRETQYQYGRSDVDDYNPFSPLRDESNRAY